MNSVITLLVLYVKNLWFVCGAGAYAQWRRLVAFRGEDDARHLWCGRSACHSLRPRCSYDTDVRGGPAGRVCLGRPCAAAEVARGRLAACWFDSLGTRLLLMRDV